MIYKNKPDNQAKTLAYLAKLTCWLFLPWCCRKRPFVPAPPPTPSVRRMPCARSIVQMSIGGLCLRQALHLPLHGPTQRAAHLTHMYNSIWGLVNNGLHDGRGVSGYLESQLGLHRKVSGSAVHDKNIYRYFSYWTLSRFQRGRYR